MPYTKTILCLANSRKPGGHCVAGREVVQQGFDAWVRPVSSRATREVSDDDERYRDGSLPHLLDLIEIDFEIAVPDRHQQENHQIDDKHYWKRCGIASWADIPGLVEDVSGELWLNGSSSTYGENDRVQEANLDRFTRSLYLVEPDDLALIVAEEGAQFGDPRRRVRAAFRLSGHSYTLGVTDLPIEQEYLAKPNGRYRIKGALVCVSLGEVFHGYAYKLAAGIITPQRTGRRQ